MKKKVLTLSAILIIVICSLFFCISASAEVYSGACGANGNNVTYTLDTETGLLEISGTGAMADYMPYNSIPWYPKNSYIKTVKFSDGITSIGKMAFYGCINLTSVSITDSVTSIGSYAFYVCKGLTVVTIPDRVTSIGTLAFGNCANLTIVTLPNSVTSIGHSAFYGCSSLTSINIPNSITSIDNQTFDGCSSLTSINIPNSVTSIDYLAFTNCSNLASVTFETKNATIDSDAFDGCEALGTIYLYKNSTADTYFSSNEYTKIYLQEEIASPESDFKYSVNSDGVSATITKYVGAGGDVIIPSTIAGYSVTSIGWQAFQSCDSITSLIIPDSVTSIAYEAFFGCSGLTSIIIPGSVKSIDTYAFAISGLESVIIEDGVTSISDSMFYQCFDLESITISNSVTEIGSYAFFDCKKLESITIPDSVTSINSSAFDRCTSLTSVTIGNGATSIDLGAFYRCSSLMTIDVDENNKYYCDIDGILLTKDEKTLIQYPIGKNSTEYTIPDSVTSVGRVAFTYCKSLTSVNIPDSVTSIGKYAFYSCYNLTAIDVDENNDYYCDIDGILLTKDEKTLTQYPIGKNSTEYTIPDSVTSIGFAAFYYCKSLTSVTIPDNVTSIGDSAFYYCSSLTGVTIPDNVTSIGYYAFRDCISLTNATFKTKDVTISSNAFSYSSRLKTIYLYKDSTADTYFSADKYTKIYLDEITADNFMTFEGYQVRDVDYNGLRSRFVVDCTAMPTLENDGFEVIEVGAIFASTEKLEANGDEFIVSKGGDGTYKTVSYGMTVPVLKNGVLVGKYVSKTDDELVFACTITNFDATNYNKLVSSRGYAVLADASGNEYVVYCDYEVEEYRNVSLEMICDSLYAEGQITADNISYQKVVAFRKEN